MKRTLQDWSNFLNMYVFINADGSVRATHKKPELSGSRDSSHSNKAIRSMNVYWNVFSDDLIEIPSNAVSYDEFSKIQVGSFIKESYFIGWESSLKTPSKNNSTPSNAV